MNSYSFLSLKYFNNICLFLTKILICLFQMILIPLHYFQSRQEFDNELLERFGSLVKIPLLEPDR